MPQQAHAGLAWFIEKDSDGFLRFVPNLDAAASGALGVLGLLAAEGQESGVAPRCADGD